MAMRSRTVPTLASLGLRAAVAAILCLLSCHSASAEVRLGIRPQLGIEAAEGTSGSEGLVIEAVEPKLPAGRAGMVKGDLLLSLNGSPVRTALDVRAILVGMAPGQPLKIRFRHGSAVVDKEERPTDVPELPSYELLEGRGIKGSVMVGDTREQVEKTLGKPRAEGRRGSLISLDYPRHGIMVGLEPLDGKPRVMFVVVHFPFIGVTSRGLSTEGTPGRHPSGVPGREGGKRCRPQREPERGPPRPGRAVHVPGGLHHRNRAAPRGAHGGAFAQSHSLRGSPPHGDPSSAEARPRPPTAGDPCGMPTLRRGRSRPRAPGAAARHHEPRPGAAPFPHPAPAPSRASRNGSAAPE